MESSFEWREWWGRQNKWWRVLWVALAVVIAGFGAFVLSALIEDILRRWQAGILLEPLFNQPIVWVAIGVVAALIALLLLIVVISIIWAWIALPFTLRAGVAAMNELRLEVQRLRHQLRPASADTDDDFEIEIDDDA